MAQWRGQGDGGHRDRTTRKSTRARVDTTKPHRESRHTDGGSHRDCTGGYVTGRRKFSPHWATVDPGAAIVFHLRWLGSGTGDWRLPAVSVISLLSAHQCSRFYVQCW